MSKINRPKFQNIKNYNPENFEPDGKDLIEYQKVEEMWFLQTPNYDPEDHWYALQTDIRLGK